MLRLLEYFDLLLSFFSFKIAFFSFNSVFFDTDLLHYSNPLQLLVFALLIGLNLLKLRHHFIKVADSPLQAAEKKNSAPYSIRIPLFQVFFSLIKFLNQDHVIFLWHQDQLDSTSHQYRQFTTSFLIFIYRTFFMVSHFVSDGDVKIFFCYCL